MTALTVAVLFVTFCGERGRVSTGVSEQGVELGTTQQHTITALKPTYIYSTTCEGPCLLVYYGPHHW